MTTKVILPPNYLENINGRLIFLAGPIQGAYNWQEQAIETLQTLAPELYVASPRRREIIKKGEFTIDMYNEQVDWETYHLRKAGENGAILFWLTKESEHICRRAYAQTSRFELAEWKIRHERDGSNLVVGIEEGFSGAKYIQRRLSQDCPDVPICSTLEETCKTAILIS
ncbi:hypothetical protein GOV03_04455 [Candidatus Woesearchaeota archaeon]|nr:hypothetical protein [Candidatus Woesearchaeota archaeon]